MLLLACQVSNLIALSSVRVPFHQGTFFFFCCGAVCGTPCCAACGIILFIIAASLLMFVLSVKVSFMSLVIFSNSCQSAFVLKKGREKLVV